MTTGFLCLLILPIFIWVGSVFPDSFLAVHLHENRPWFKFLVAGWILAFLASFLGAILWNRAGRVLPNTLSGQLIVSETVFGLLYVLAWEARFPSVLEIIAMVFLITGVIKAIRAH